jgi:hypothetical protein
MFTSAVNRPKIQEVFGVLFNNDPKRNYLIDYSKCTNERIRQNIVASIGTDKCWISYDSAKETYLLKDSNGNPLQSRALVWDGVKVIPEAVVIGQAKQELDRQLSERTDKLLNKEIVSIEEGTKGAELAKLVPIKLRTKLNSAGLMKDFLNKVDYRVGQMIIEAKKSGYTLRQDAVSKLNFSSGLMEAHFMYNNIYT